MEGSARMETKLGTKDRLSRRDNSPDELDMCKDRARAFDTEPQIRCGPQMQAYHIPIYERRAREAYCVTPPHLPGRVTLEYSPNGDVLATSDSRGRRMRFEFYEAAVSSVMPRGIPLTGGTPIVLRGLRFKQSSLVTVRFTDGKREATVSGQYVSETELTCKSPDFTKFGALDVVVRVSIGGEPYTVNECHYSFYANTSAKRCMAFGPGLLQVTLALRLLTYVSLFRVLGPLLVTVVSMFSDTISFVGVYAVVLLAFANGQNVCKLNDLTGLAGDALDLKQVLDEVCECEALPRVGRRRTSKEGVGHAVRERRARRRRRSSARSHRSTRG